MFLFSQIVYADHISGVNALIAGSQDVPVYAHCTFEQELKSISE